MNNVHDIDNVLKLKIKSQDYNSAIDILKKEILKSYTVKIQETDRKFKYSNIINLMSKSSKILDKEYNNTLKKYFIITNDECCEEYELYTLMDIYSKLKKGGISNEF